MLVQKGVPTHFLLRLVLFAAFAVPGRGDFTLEQADRAQRLLGRETWSRIIAIEHDSPRSAYPRAFHALVFELSGILWFYTPLDGTQSFSLHVGDLEGEKADFTPLVRAIEPGFVRWHTVDEAAVTAGPGVTLSNGCFIDSIVALRERLARGEVLTMPRLVSYYVDTPSGLRGHTVLAFEQAGQVVVYDAARPKRVVMLPAQRAEVGALARAAHGARVGSAREWKLDVATEARIARAGIQESVGSQT